MTPYTPRQMVRIYAAIHDHPDLDDARRHLRLTRPDDPRFEFKPWLQLEPIPVTVDQLAEWRDSTDYRGFCELSYGEYTPQRQQQLRAEREAHDAAREAHDAAIRRAAHYRRLNDAGIQPNTAATGAA